MAADDVARALMAMEDESVRSKVRGGNLSPFDDLRLSAKEEGLVREAAKEEVDADVEGFDWGSSPTFAAISYSKGNLYNAGVQSNFSKFVSSRYGGISSVLQGGCACPPMKGGAMGI